MTGIKKYNIGGYGSGWSSPSDLNSNSQYSWGSTTYGPNTAGTPLDQQYNQYMSKQALQPAIDAENWYDTQTENFYNTVPAAERTANMQQLSGSGVKMANEFRKLPKGSLNDKWGDYKSKFQMQPVMESVSPPPGTMTSASMQQSYSPQMVAEMKLNGTLPADAVASPTEIQVGTKAPWSLSGQKAATWSMNTGVGKVGTSVAPYAGFATIAGKGIEIWSDDKKPETANFGEVAGAVVGGAGQGAAIGQMILPGIGAIAGAVVGGLVGGINKVKRAKKYKKYLGELAQYKEDLAEYEEGRRDYKDATTLYGSAPIMKRYYEKGGYTNNTKLLAYEKE